jgi:hypothetical protein
MNEEEFKKNAKATFNKIFEDQDKKRAKFYYPLIVILTWAWGIPILCFIFIVQGIDWVLTKCHLKKPEPRRVPHYYLIGEIETRDEIFKHEDESVVKAEEARLISELGEDKYNQTYYLSEAHICGFVPQTVVQKIVHVADSLLP